MRLLLTKDGVVALKGAVEGSSEFAELIRKLQRRIVGNMLMLTREQYTLLQRYAGGSGAEGNRAKAILEGAQPG